MLQSVRLRLESRRFERAKAFHTLKTDLCASLERSRLILSSTGKGIVDRQCWVAETTLEYPKEEVVGQSILFLMCVCAHMHTHTHTRMRA